MTKFSWTCPHCSRAQVVTDQNYSTISGHLRVSELNVGEVGARVIGISCLNDSCKNLTLHCALVEAKHQGYAGEQLGKVLKTWRLIPESFAIAQPDFVPAPLREDYYEACRVRDLSPKSSATLARRCLQGMIRDFCKIAKGTLQAEIDELRDQVKQGTAPSGVTPESVDAIDQVRSIGNVGAHMEKDINVIVEVDPGEAEALTDLIELLFAEWYVARQERQEKLARIGAIAAQKKAIIAEAKAKKLAGESAPGDQQPRPDDKSDAE